MMTDQVVLLESRTMRAALGARVEALDKVKALELLPDGVHITARMAADYFEVEYEAVKKLVQRHKEELRANGLSVVRGSDLQLFERDNMSLSVLESYPQGRSHLTVLPRRAVLNLAMLLRDSEVARRVRTQLLDVEDLARSGPRDSAAVMRVLDLQAELIGAMSVRLAQVQSAVDGVSTALQAFREEVGELRASRTSTRRR